MLQTISKRRLLRDAAFNVLPSILLIVVFFKRSGNYFLENNRERGYLSSLFAIIGAAVLLQYAWNSMCHVGSILIWKIRHCCSSRSSSPLQAGRWAIITGASSPIAAEFCFKVAQKKLNIMLVGKNTDKMKQIASTLEATYNVKTKVVVHDFGHYDADCSQQKKFQENMIPKLQKLISQYKATGRGGIGLVVNCVNSRNQIPSLAHEMDPNDVKHMMKANIGGAVDLMETVLPFLLQQGRKYKSAMITVSSHSSHHPAPMMSLYSATNAFRTEFSRSLYSKCKSEGIDVLSVTPELISSNMPRKRQNAQYVKSPSADKIVAAAFRTLGHQEEAFPLLGHAQSTFFPHLFWIDPWDRFRYKMEEARTEILTRRYEEGK